MGKFVCSMSNLLPRNCKKKLQKKRRALTIKDKNEIIEKLYKKMMSQKELSLKYSVVPSVISRTIGPGPQFYLLVVVINLKKA